MTTQQARFTYMESQAAHIESRVRMIQHGSIQYPSLVGISREASPFNDTITYYSSDFTGQMEPISNAGTDFPLVNLTKQQHNVPIQWDGIAYDYTDQEIGRAMLVGDPLSDRKVRAAFRIAEERKEEVFLRGNSHLGWDGLINHTSIPSQAGTAWANETDENIFNQVNSMIGGAWAGTNQVRLCDTLLLPTVQFVTLNRPMGNDANTSVMKFIKENNPYTTITGRPLRISTLRQLDNAHNNGTEDRAVAYPRDMEVLRYHIPQELQFIEPERRGMTWIYHGYLVLAGLEIMEPNAFRYLNGI